MKYPAIIDLGTNTFHLLIGKMKAAPVLKKRIHVLLAKDRLENGEISAGGINRAIDALLEFKESIGEYQAEPVIAVATEAFRSAANRELLLAEIDRKTGIGVEVISGEREAELIYLGVRQSMNFGKETALIMDVGGGSVEFILANSKKIIDKFSFNTGAAYLLKKINPSDPITKVEFDQACEYLHKTFASLFQAMRVHQPRVLIGSSGSFETIADIIAARMGNNEKKAEDVSLEIDLQEFESIKKQLLNSTFEERLLMQGMIPMRADMIVAALVIIDLIQKEGNFQKIFMSKYALKEGLLWSHLNEQKSKGFVWQKYW